MYSVAIAPAGGLPSDETPPTPPTTVSAVADSSTEVTVSWSGAADDVAVTSYTLYRDGNPIITTPNTSYSDTPLIPETPYTYAVMAHDAAGNDSALSATAVVTTPAPADTTVPTVSLTTPTDGTTGSGMATVSADAFDEIGVVGVQFQLDGTNLGAEDTTNDYSVDWDTSALTPGSSYTLTAIARDEAGK